MTGRDAFRFINELDRETVGLLAARLEFRGRDSLFTQWRETYLDSLDLAPGGRVLDLGSGTGVVARAIARRPGFGGEVVGIDQSAQFLDEARALTSRDGLDDRVHFDEGDVQALPYPGASFDAVVAHTTISHVTDPDAMLREMARVLRSGGTFAIFDGDYASWTFDYPDPAVAKSVEEAFIAAIVNNPRILRELPRWLRDSGLEMTRVFPWVYADIGEGAFFANAVETYAPIMAQAGAVPTASADAWLQHQRQARADGTFFGACVYYAYTGVRSAG